MNKELMWSESVEQVTYEMVAGKKKKKKQDPQMACAVIFRGHSEVTQG